MRSWILKAYRWPNICKASAILALATSQLVTPHALAESHTTSTAQDVMIDAGDITLAATITRPLKAQKQALPVIVIAHGSAPSTREGVGFYKQIALKMGFAALTFDKRGVGQSTGVYEAFNVEDSPRVFNDLANDIVHAINWVATQTDINKQCIGLLGGSQAGWIMPLAATKTGKVAFIAIGEGTAVSAGEEEIHGLTLRRQYGSEFASEITLAAVAKADAALLNYNGPKGFDPELTLNQIDTPTFWMFGLRDYVIPVMPSLDKLETLIRSGKTNNNIHVFPFGDHNFSNTATGKRYDLQNVIERWLKNTPAGGCLEENGFEH